MRTILKAHRAWFWVVYILGLAYMAIYLVAAKNEGEAWFANMCILVLSHVFVVSAYVLTNSKMRQKLLLRTFACFVMAYGCLLTLTPKVLGLIGAYALFLSIGWVHVRIIKDTDILPNDGEGMSAKEIASSKYLLWIMISITMLFMLYWNC